MLLDMLNYIVERSQDFTTALGQHLYLTFISLAISVVLGLVFGIIASRVKWLRKTLLTTISIGALTTWPKRFTMYRYRHSGNRQNSR